MFQDKLTQLDQEALVDNVQFDVVLKCISEPLTWLQDDPTLVRHAAWKRHVWTVFKDIVPRWTFALSSNAHRPLLEATLTTKEHADAFTMAKVSLPILLECLSTGQDTASLDTLEMYASYLKFMSLDSNVFQLYAQHSTKTNASFFCNLLCSIPGQLANVFGIQLNQVSFNAQHEWYIDRNFYAKISKRLAENLDTKSLLFSQELISKISRQGYEDILIKSIYPIARLSPDLWSSVLEPCFNQLTKPILYLVKQEILPHTSSIKRASKELSAILFNTNTILIDDFLNTALLRLSKYHWADDILARLAICTSIMTTAQPEELVLKFTKRIIGTWSDPTFIKHGSSRERIYMTQVILCLVAYLPDDMIKSTIMTQTPLLHSVSSYFDSGDISTAQLGAVIAEAISSRIDKEKPIDTGLLDSSEELQKMKGLVNIKDADDDDATDIIISEQGGNLFESEQEEEEEEEEELDPDAIYCPDDEEDEDEEDDSDDEFQAYQMEEESDDEGLKKEETSKSRSKTKKPVFVRDLVRHLKDHSDPLKLEIGLNAAEQVVRQKIGAGTELSEYGLELARYLIAFPETFEIDNFRNLQQNALIALIVAVPEKVTGFIIDQLYDRNTSAGQKQLILGCISLAVRELSGWSTTSDMTAVKEETRKQLENTSISDNNNNSKVGTTVFISRRMELDKQQKQNIRKNKLSGLAGPIFFFPLLVGWWEGAQGRIKYWIGNNKMLSERFIMTLNIILHSSTNIPDKRKIVKEYFEFVSSMKYATHDSFGIKKALLLGIDTIVNTSYKGQEALLFHDYTRELSETKDWLQEIMENNAEHKLQEIAIGVLLKLSQIVTSNYIG